MKLRFIQFILLEFVSVCSWKRKVQIWILCRWCHKCLKNGLILAIYFQIDLNKIFWFLFTTLWFYSLFQSNQFTKVLSIQTDLVSDPAIDGTVSSDPVATRKSGLRIKTQGKLGMKKRTSGVHLTCKVKIVCELAN